MRSASLPMFAMKPGVKLLTLGADDLERSLPFYRDGMGLPISHFFPRKR